MSSLALGYSAARNPQSSAVFRMHVHDLRINGSGKGTNPFLVHVSAFARIGTVLFPNHISRAERSSFLCREYCRTTWNCDLFTPTLMAPRGDAPTALLYICLSWRATVWIVYEKVKNILNSPATP